MRLLDPKDLPSVGLGQATLLDDRVDLQRELSLEQFRVGVRNAKVSENIATARCDTGVVAALDGLATDNLHG